MYDKIMVNLFYSSEKEIESNPYVAKRTKYRIAFFFFLRSFKETFLANSPADVMMKISVLFCRNIEKNLL